MRQRPRRSGYDIVVTVTGPRENCARGARSACSASGSMSARANFVERAVLSRGAAQPADQRRSPMSIRCGDCRLGLDNFLLPQQIGPDIADTVRDDPFRVASCGSRSSTVSTREAERRDVPHAGAVPRRDPDAGECADRQLRCRRRSCSPTAPDRATPDGARSRSRPGFEQFVADAAREHGLLYGLVTALMALLTGWFASVVFRRD